MTKNANKDNLSIHCSLCFFFFLQKALTVPLQPSMKIFYFWCLHSYSSYAQIEKHTNGNRMELN